MFCIDKSIVLYLFILFFLPDNQILTSNLQRTVYSNGTLVMEGISKGTTEGFYKCTAKNRHGAEASAQTRIKVIGNNVKFSFKAIFECIKRLI